jgi:myo-inositol-1(or 4)-monophosphatase
VFIDRIKITAIKAAKEAGQYALTEYDRFKRGNIKLKRYREVVTTVDLQAEKIIVKTVKKAFPNHEFLTEETGKIGKKNEWVWIIDPVDGTANYTIHNPLWAVSVAAVYRGEIVAGVIFAPVLKEIFTAIKGGGATLNGKKIHISKVKFGNGFNVYGHGRKRTDIKRALAYYASRKLAYLDCRKLGSAALGLAYLAAGRVETYAVFGTNDWDVGAGVLLVREAGGKVTDFTGKDWVLGNPDLAASNGLVHGRVLRIIN